MTLQHLKKGLFPYVLLAPCIIILLAVTIYPLIFSLGISFMSYHFVRPELKTFIGLGNYVEHLTDLLFWFSLKTTFIFVVASLTLTFLIGLGLELLLNSVPAGKSTISVLFIIPAMISPAVIGRVWRCLYDYDWGLVNYFLSFLRLGPFGWRSDPNLALPATILVDVWQWSPFVFLILFAGLQGVPHEPVEAVKIDGASRWQVFKYITLPLLRPLILVVLRFRFIDTFRVFDVIYTLTKGGPGFATETLSLWTFRVGYLMLEIGSASALAYLMLIIVVVISTYLLRALFREVE